jgi:K+-transporting ATPase ATPase C chain
MFIEFTRSIRLTGLTIILRYRLHDSHARIRSHACARATLGSLIYGNNGKVIGSRLVAQAFTRPEYLWPRPSAVDYNAAGAGGSNLSPTNP